MANEGKTIKIRQVRSAIGTKRENRIEGARRGAPAVLLAEPEIDRTGQHQAAGGGHLADARPREQGIPPGGAGIVIALRIARLEIMGDRAFRPQQQAWVLITGRH